MTWKEATEKVLADERRPMHYKDEITKMILDRGYKTASGKTPPESKVSRALTTNPDQFRMLDQGVFELIDTPATAPHTTVFRTKCAKDFIEHPEVLSPEEQELLELIVNFPLSLVNGEVCFADIMDKLEVQILDKEKSLPQSIDATLLQKKLDELKKQIENNRSKQHGDLDDTDTLWNYIYQAQQLCSRAGDKVILLPSYLLLGKFVSGKEKESKPKVVIYLKSIEKSIKNNESRWQVMAAVFVHEMFHAWNYFNAERTKKSVMEIDEPMVEFETLYFLQELEAFTKFLSHPLRDKVSCVRKNRESRVQDKQQSIGKVAAYGFGYYLFKKLNKEERDSKNWIETYSKKSASINGSYPLVEKAKDALTPIYPFKSESKVMGWFKKIIFDDRATSKTAGKPAAAKVGSDVSLRDLVLACIKIIGRKCFAAQELYAFAPIFKVCVPQYQNLENALKQQLDGLVNEGILDALPHDCYGMKLEDVEVKSKIPAPVPTPPTLVPAPTKSKGGYTKDPSIPFAVEFPDGVKIAEKNAVETFIKSLQKIGLSKVQQHAGIIIQGYNLVSDVKRPPEGKTKTWQHYVDTKYIYTKLSNPKKQKHLYTIAEKLGISIKIYDI